MTTAAQEEKSLDVAVQTLRDLDYQRYLATLVVPTQYRTPIQVLYAFAADVAAIRERVSEPAPGEIRLQWWTDALEGDAHGDVLRNPLAHALLEVLTTYELASGPLLRLLAARRFDLYHDPMPDIAQFEGYAGETVSILYQYSAMIMGRSQAGEAADAAGHLGVAQALAGHLKAFGFNAARGQLFLPLSVFAAHGVSEQEIFTGQDSQGLRASLDRVAEIAKEHVERAEAAIHNLPKALRPAFASVDLVRQALNKRKSDNPFTTEPPASGLYQLARLLWWSLRNA